VNSEIKKLHQELIKTHQSLSKRLGKTTNPDDAEAILREMEEVNFRVMMAGRLLFSETTEAMNKRIDGVADASAKLDESLARIEKIKEVVKAVGQFLALADKVLDAIKVA
jgi:hypothetical protein